MGGAGKGPGIGWSRVQPKYSEKLIYMQPAGFALTEGSNLQWKMITSRTMSIFSRVCDSNLKIHLTAHYSNATGL